MSVLTLKPHIHGNWKIVSKITIDVTCKDSACRPDLLYGSEETVFIGPLIECESYLAKQNDTRSPNGDNETE